ncbi:DUF1467 family protein [Neoehrlichia mikurensis]|uniref:DUF1467 family protein n=1 Tax=Neoehrlichia mikurensis TaxID=89586 RepID=A0A9Q9F424_9RICK|nr:DUF1467 family protein [Neoehrlichia mikurensis]QXK92262.1 DUF1467 family protein [Neoehrlichia mikurensis]QXK92716.1 DUF1467 family protein [Neoehrlichia mikurensis]QXK93955.1 DUF1467 family protein [Neoehrlichia mikurensis]UTO55880.1 DUF1467 family protein [Neoehrlichia mikurensis]UTO56796.1 DUF1467 family protein [Neoehrlichia mikurensis]
MIVNVAVFFIVTWWIIFFIILPVKVKIDMNLKVGLASSGPTKAYLLTKVIITTVVTVILSVLYYYCQVNGYINLEYLYNFVP